MSQNLYGQVEVYDQKEEVWKHAPLYKETENGEYKAVDLFRGGRMTVNAVMGKEFFDPEFFNQEKGMHELNVTIDAIISNAKKIKLKDLAKETYYNVAGPLLGLITPSQVAEDQVEFACYTGFDIMLLEVLSRQISRSAKEFFDEYFGHIKSVIQVVSAAYGVYDDRHIRVILYGL